MFGNLDFELVEAWVEGILMYMVAWTLLSIRDQVKHAHFLGTTRYIWLCFFVQVRTCENTQLVVVNMQCHVSSYLYMYL